MRVRLASLCVLVLLAGTGCSEKIRSQFVQNMPPEVRLTQAPVSTGDQYFYAYRMNWVGYDPDGRIDYFIIAVDPDDPAVIDTTTRAGHSVWQRTAKNEEIVFFRATRPDTSLPGDVAARANDFHTFAVAAVDNQGAISPPVWRTFTSFTVVPSVTIVTPRPNPYSTPIVTPSVRINWTGVDPDGQFTVKPIKYKYKLFRPRDPDFPGVADPVSEILSNPKILRWKYAPTFGPSDSCPTCSYWDSTSGETTDVQYTNLVPNNTYAFAVTGFDEAGAYDPNFSRLTNVLKLFVSYAGALGPQICMFNQYFNYCYVSGGYANDPTRYFNVEVPAGQLVTFNWFAIPPEGADIRRYRWVLDLFDLTDETPRENEVTDWYHWSAYGLQSTSATIGPFQNNGEVHLFFIEAEDNNGLRSLGIIRFTVVRATFEKDLLFVDDTRLSPDNLINGEWEAPRGTWPTAAELDTFFFARGDYPWIGYPGWDPIGNHAPDVARSPEGIFDGFEFDTTGTRGTVSGLVPLATLGRYKTVVWYVDDISSAYIGNPTDLIAPITSLRAMSSPGRPSTISTYLQQGGRLWLFGGGAGYATTSPWNRKNTPPDEFDNTSNEPELRPGRFMYDFTHWRSAFMIRPSQFALLNQPQFRPPYQNASVGRGNWQNHGINRNLNMPDYSKLLTNAPFLGPRNCGSDPPSPLRSCDSYYLISYYSAEFMGTLGAIGTNNIVEDADPSLDIVREESTLDTMYFTVGGTAPYGRPVMTYYHGFETPQMVFSGFPLWHFQKAQARALADFVLGDIFGLPRAASATASTRLRASTSSTQTKARPWAAPPLRR